MRFVDEPRRRFGAIAGVGAVVLMLSRPFEGLLVCVAFGAGLLRAPRASLPRFVLPLAVVVAIGASLLLFYDHRVTGDALTLPYLLYERMHGPMPIFVWGRPRLEPAVATQPFVDFVAFNVRAYHHATSASTAVPAAFARLGTYTEIFLVFPLAFALPFALLDRDAARRHESRVAAAAVSGCLAIMLVSVFAFPHYAAPLSALFVLLLVRGVLAAGDRLATPRRSTVLVASMLIATVALAAARGDAMAGRYAKLWPHERARIADELVAGGEKHVVLVSYRAPHDFLREWVYNGADLEGAPVLWARSLDDASDRQLLAHYPERKHWRIIVSNDGHELIPVL